MDKNDQKGVDELKEEQNEDAKSHSEVKKEK